MLSSRLFCSRAGPRCDGGRTCSLNVFIYICTDIFTDGSYTKGTRALMHRELIREWR